MKRIEKCPRCGKEGFLVMTIQKVYRGRTKYRPSIRIEHYDEKSGQHIKTKVCTITRSLLVKMIKKWTENKFS
ncbi:hypothetical protein ES703_115221 [subsurface metagenome]